MERAGQKLSVTDLQCAGRSLRILYGTLRAGRPGHAVAGCCDRFLGTSFFASCTVFFHAMFCRLCRAGEQGRSFFCSGCGRGVVGRLVVTTGRYAGALMRFWPYAVAPALSGR